MEESCCDHIATLRIVVEQTLEWKTRLRMVFVDFGKAFDSIGRDTLWKILRPYVIPLKIVKMIRIFYEGFQASVLQEPFEVKAGPSGMPA